LLVCTELGRKCLRDFIIHIAVISKKLGAPGVASGMLIISSSLINVLHNPFPVCEECLKVPINAQDILSEVSAVVEVVGDKASAMSEP
jgi:Na+/H+-dicarboxylate symporter